MGNKLDSSADHGDLSVTNADFLEFEFDVHSMETDKTTDKADIEIAGFTPATEQNLNHLDAGCFVLVLRDDVYCWAEVVSIEGNTVNGYLNNELSTTACKQEHHKLEITQFYRDQIKALGCDRYCWC